MAQPPPPTRDYQTAYEQIMDIQESVDQQGINIPNEIGVSYEEYRQEILPNIVTQYLSRPNNNQTSIAFFRAYIRELIDRYNQLLAQRAQRGPLPSRRTPSNVPSQPPLKRGGAKSNNKWISYVKAVQKHYNCSYTDALKLASKTYKK